MSQEGLVPCTSECFYRSSTPSSSLPANAGLQKTLGFVGLSALGFRRPAKAAAKAAPPEPGAGPAQPKGNKRPSGRVWGARTRRPDASPGSEGGRLRAGGTARSLPVGPAVIPAPGSGGRKQDDAVRGRGAPSLICPVPAPSPGGIPARVSLRGRWVRGRQGPHPALCCRSHFAGAAGLGIPGSRGSLASSSSSFPTSSASSGAGRMMAAAAVAEVSSAGSSSTDTSSTGEEERMRRLFQTCDGDGDGFISR